MSEEQVQQPAGQEVEVATDAQAPEWVEGRLSQKSRRAAAKAVKEAMKAASKSSATATESVTSDEVVTDEVSGTQAEVEAKAEPAESVSDKLGRLVKEREKAKSIRREAEEQRANAMREIEAERNKLKAELEEQRQIRDQLELLRQNPLEGMRKLKIEPEDFLERIVKSDPKDLVARQKEEALNRELSDLKKWKQELEESLRKGHEENGQRVEYQRREQILNEFLKTANDADKYPNFSSLYGGDHEYQVTLGHRAADHIREHLGYQPSRDEILEYLEHEATKKSGNRSAGQSAQGGAKGLPKTVGKSDLTDRKGSPVSVPDDWEERKRLAKARVKAEMKGFDSLEDD